MTLEAQPQRIREFADRLQELADDTTKARTYVSDHIELDDTSNGLLNLVVPLDNAVSFNVASMVTGIKTALHESAPALRAVADYYRATDHDVAVDMDKQLEKVAPIAEGAGYDHDDDPQDSVPLEGGGSSTDAADGAQYYIELPSEVLQYPYPDSAIERDLVGWAAVTDWLDPIESIRKGLEFVFDYNPGEEFAGWLLGDWEAVAKAGTAITQLGDWSDQMADEIIGSSLFAGLFWNGRAADAAAAYFEGFAATVQGASPSLNDTADRYRAMASGMYTLAEVVADCIHTCEDKLIQIGVKALAGLISSETVVLPLILGAWALSDAAKCVEKVDEAISKYEETRSLIEACAGSGAMFIASLPGVDALPLPGPYSAPKGI